MRVDEEKCIWCGMCAAFCPIHAARQGDGHYEIDTDTCVKCGVCATNCPVKAISEQIKYTPS